MTTKEFIDGNNFNPFQREEILHAHGLIEKYDSFRKIVIVIEGGKKIKVSGDKNGVECGFDGTMDNYKHIVGYTGLIK